MHAGLEGTHRQDVALGRRAQRGSTSGYLCAEAVQHRTRRSKFSTVSLVAEIGSYGGAAARIKIVQKINHDGEVNRARYCPQNCDLIATRTVTGETYVFDRTKHSSNPNPDGKCKPDIILKGQTKEG